MTDPTTPRKGGRKRTTTDLGQTILKRERQKLAREQAALAEAMAQEALQQQAYDFRQRHQVATKVTPEHLAVSRGLIRRTAAVLASSGVNLPIHAHASADKFAGWTDFKKIDVTYKVMDNPRMLAAILKALLYHEGGHNQYTEPFLDLADLVKEKLGFVPTPVGHSTFNVMHRAWNLLEDQRMETAVVCDSPVKAMFFTPMILAEFVPTKDHAAANWPVIARRTYLPDHIVAGARKLWVLQHNLMGMDGEALASKLEAIIDRYIYATDAVTMWTCVGEAFELLQACRPVKADLEDMGHKRQTKRSNRPDNMEDFLTIPLPPMPTPPICSDPAPVWDDEDDFDGEDPEDEDWTEEMTDPDDFAHFLDILFTLLNGGDIIGIRYVQMGEEAGESTEEGGSSSGDIMDEPQRDGGDTTPPTTDVDEDNAEEPETGSGADQGMDDTTPEQDEEPSKGGSGGGDSEETPEPELTDEMLQDALATAEEERDNSSIIDEDVDAYNDALENQASELDVYMGGVSTDGEAILQAENLAREIESAFRAVTADREPAWVEQQRRGVINVVRYTTRNPGDVEFFRQWKDDENPGHDIAVSVLLDRSGSMYGQTGQLAQAGYACKVACQNLDIPCTVTLWDNNAVTLWDAKEHAEYLPVVNTAGSTDPTEALQDLNNQRYDRSKHIVLIMTDGEFDKEWNKRNFAFYQDAGRTFVGFGFGSQVYTNSLHERGCEQAHTIRDLMDIPRHLEDLLIALA